MVDELMMVNNGLQLLQRIMKLEPNMLAPVHGTAMVHGKHAMRRSVVKILELSIKQSWP